MPSMEEKLMMERALRKVRTLDVVFWQISSFLEDSVAIVYDLGMGL